MNRERPGGGVNSTINAQSAPYESSHSRSVLKTKDLRLGTALAIHISVKRRTAVITDRLLRFV